MTEDDIYYYLPSKYYKSHRYWMLGHILKHKYKILLISVLTVFGIICQTIIPLIFGKAIDEALPHADFGLLLYFSLLIIAIGLLMAVLTYLASIINTIVAQNVEMQVRVEFFDNLASKKMDFFNKSRVGDLMSQATQDTQNMTFAIAPGIRSIVSSIVGMIAAAVAMYSLNRSLSLIFIVILPLYTFFMYKYARDLQPFSRERQERLAKVNAILQENITGIRVVRTFSAQNTEKKVFTEEIKKYENVLIKRGALSAFFIPTLLLGFVTSLIFLSGIYLIKLSSLGITNMSLLGIITIPIQPFTIGDLIAFISLTGLLLMPTNFLRFLLDRTMLGFAGSKRIFDTLTTEARLEQGKRIKLNNIIGEVEFENVNFSYEKDVGLKALEDFSLKISPGEIIAIIGPTGSGKSTVGKLLLRLYDIDSGVIKIDGINISDIDLNQLRRMVGVIEQDTYLFSTSIKANIAYGIYSMDDERIVDAAKAAQAHEFIIEFKDQYDTILGERGITLSGGQKQRVAMARTFITDPKILIMDDSTSSVDAETEAKIQQATAKLLKGRTTIIITHRLSTLKNADKIIFMRKGRIEKIGTHEELIETFKPYRQIFENYIKLPPIKTGSKVGEI